MILRPDLHAEPYVFAAAQVSQTLAAAGVSCNVIAGLAHDRLFVPWEQGARALALLHAM